MPFYLWSQVAATNSNSDPTCPFPVGMSPSAVGSGIRAEMASLKKWGDEISIGIGTGGSPVAYTVVSYSGFDTLAHMNGAMIAFTPHATNGPTVTLNVDSLGAKPLRSAPGVELPGGTIIQGTPYAATYNNSSGEWILHGLYGNPYNIPLLGGIDYWGTTAPNSSFIFPVGQALSRTVYATAFAIMGTTFGAGDGSTTFNAPDKRGRVSAAWDAMGGAGASRFSPAFGGVTGTENVTLVGGQIPGHTHSGTTGVDSPDHGHSETTSGATWVNGGGSAGPYQVMANQTTALTGGANVRHGHPFTTDAGAGLGGGAHSNTQPTIVCNYIMRII